MKVLDFGLAKAAAPHLGLDVANSPTFTVAATQLGVIVGTAAYMAPEQARGKVVNKRADIWAFGCVLFEMLTGRQAFGGETVTDLLAAVVERQPDWTLLPRTTSPRLCELLRRCLEKDPKQRLRDVGDARLAIEDAVADSTRLTAATSAAGSDRTWVRGFLPVIAAGILGAAIAGVVLLKWPSRGSTSARGIAKLEISLPSATRLGGLVGFPAVAMSPDSSGSRSWVFGMGCARSISDRSTATGQHSSPARTARPIRFSPPTGNGLDSLPTAGSRKWP